MAAKYGDRYGGVPPRALLLETHSTQATPLPAQLRQRGAVDPLRAQHVDVVELGKLFRSERLGRAERHVAGVMNDHVQPAALGNDLRDACLARCLGRDIQLDRAQIHAVFGGVPLHRFHLRRIAPWVSRMLA